jgi:hypothetical protein
MKSFEPRYRLIRYGQATKIEKASRQQRRLPLSYSAMLYTLEDQKKMILITYFNRQAEEESIEGVSGNCEDKGWRQEEEISGHCAATRMDVRARMENSADASYCWSLVT